MMCIHTSWYACSVVCTKKHLNRMKERRIPKTFVKYKVVEKEFRKRFNRLNYVQNWRNGKGKVKENDILFVYYDVPRLIIPG